MFPYLRIPNRPVRLAIIAAHTAREALDSIEVDFSGPEQKLAEQIAALSTKVDALQARLEDIDETQTADAPKPKAKAKRKPRAKK
jgi:hypothetical protein